tara:strand:- start:1679 stop:2662 length:984 start_codon:yes stop_codon:yes gene_type:complete
MSNEQLVSSPMGGAPEDEDVQEEISEEVELDIVDDTPEQDRNRKSPKDESRSDHEEELKSVSQSVQKRIKKLKFDYHEERRNKESAARLRDEAVSYAQKISEENKQLRDLLNRGEQVLIDEVKNRTEKDVFSAKEKLKRAHEEGDIDALADAQEQLTKASYEAQRASEFKPVSDTPSQEQPVEQQQAASQVPTPDPKAAQWASKNPWFQTDREMTAFAFAVHEGLVKQGVNPTSNQYYSLIDKKMQERFPDKFESASEAEEPAEESNLRSDGATRKPSTVVAPARRTTGAKNRKIRMTKTQVALAKRLGITPEQYAKQVLELEKANG